MKKIVNYDFSLSFYGQLVSLKSNRSLSQVREANSSSNLQLAASGKRPKLH